MGRSKNTQPIYNELDHGSLYVIIRKLEDRIDVAEANIDTLKGHIKKLNDKMRLSIGVSKEALNQTVLIRAKEYTEEKKYRYSFDRTPGIKLWMEHLKQTYIPVESDELIRLYKEDKLIRIANIRQDLASRFGEHFLNDTFIKKRKMSMMLTKCGFIHNVSRMFLKRNGIGFDSITDIVCVEKNGELKSF